MKRPVILIALLMGAILLTAARSSSAADQAAMRSSSWRHPLQRPEPPFSRSERAQAVWASGACWTECGSHCAWGQTGCLQHDTQGQCVKLTDACDRYCQRDCRTSGGPLLPIDFFWE